MTSAVGFEQSVDWLLSSEDPSVRYLTLTEVVAASPRSAAVRRARREIPSGRRVRALLHGQQDDGGFGIHPYGKWTGAHWRLVSLVELAAPVDGRLRAAADQVLGWLCSNGHRRGVKTIEGRARMHGSMEGNALAVCTRLGLARDERVLSLADALISAQWPDGGWNCHADRDAHHSSFYESLAPLWGLAEYARATGDADAAQATARAAELFLRHRLFRSDTTGEVINEEWLRLHYPVYWHYDLLQGLLILDRAGYLADERTTEALELVEAKRDEEGRWRADGRSYWRRPGSNGPNVEVVDWGRSGPNEFITLNALRVLRAAGRL